jgi:AcrR family transcriptional regulator
MTISGQELAAPAAVERGPRARMKRIMLDTAMQLMQSGLMPSVSDVAEAAQVSRATAYRYFPTQAAMIQAAVDAGLGPILEWESPASDVEKRVSDLIAFSYPRISAYEATHRAALRLALDQWARRQAGTFGNETRIVRGNRKRLLRKALAPLADTLDSETFDTVTQALSLMFGIEAMIVLKDIWGLDREQAERVAIWSARSLVHMAIAENGARKPSVSTANKKKTPVSKPRNGKSK